MCHGVYYTYGMTPQVARNWSLCAVNKHITLQALETLLHHAYVVSVQKDGNFLWLFRNFMSVIDTSILDDQSVFKQDHDSILCIKQAFYLRHLTYVNKRTDPTRTALQEQFFRQRIKANIYLPNS